MTIFSAKEAARRFGEALKAARAGPVFIEKHGKREGVLISARQFEIYEAMRAERDGSRLLSTIESAIDRYKSGEIAESRKLIDQFNDLWRRERGGAN
ncbi:MAG TPA: type II toxin-antitoxin system prevent-host-death family antitoxin [Parvularculaceae bacterium]|nr:type II toxin-antitoxin system Phd/YefM family antitoxin [Amphiplicatus sp.]MCB9955520.1 type II toxin-antitoxin system Phd/YefM family antitoxin [Caulobacterales bacterium]HOP18536.1 type II toxin-antitoxin system prevent-host-death family antitoxin [Amphiplicatus sp.]HPE29841.1 type II toxin-antitoxin system prevent-host-death family antitoxin [Parvularculaceae bacterium]HRX38711.1 type II toxin-antitoxin system prevent-host-death family antitoxin [Parvularculaceae bacterium]